MPAALLRHSRAAVRQLTRAQELESNHCTTRLHAKQAPEPAEARCPTVACHARWLQVRRLAPWHLRGRRALVTITCAVFGQQGEVLATYNDEVRDPSACPVRQLLQNCVALGWQELRHTVCGVLAAGCPFIPSHLLLIHSQSSAPAAGCRTYTCLPRRSVPRPPMAVPPASARSRRGGSAAAAMAAVAASTAPSALGAGELAIAGRRSRKQGWGPNSAGLRQLQHWLKLSARGQPRAQRRRWQHMPGCGTGWSWKKGQRRQGASSAPACRPSQQRVLTARRAGRQMRLGWTASRHRTAVGSRSKKRQLPGGSR